MLVLTRKPDQQIQIGDNIKITVVRVKGQSVRIGIEAPAAVRVMRTELMFGEPAPQSQSQASQPTAEMVATASTARSAASSPAKQSATSGSHSSDSDEEQRRNPFVPQYSRIPGASHSSLVRRPQRLGPVVLRSMAGRV